MTDHATPTHRRRARRPVHTAEYRLYFSAIYVTALPVACVRWLAAAPVDRRRSPLGEARAMTEEVLSYVFMA